MNSRYRKVEIIGRGISSIVYRGEDTLTHSSVAIKVLNPNLNSDPVLIERFRRELQIAREIQDPHVISIYDFCVEGSEKFLVMELLSGIDLKSYILSHHPLSVDFVVAFMKKVLISLKTCHQKKVLHRDLKPQNIFVLKDESPKIIDFGISRLASQSEITVAGTALGSPEYMAPELFNLPFFDFRSDIYALGIIFFEMLTGQLPFQGDSIATLYQEHLNKPLPSIQSLREDVPDWLVAIVEKMTMKEITHRYQGIEEILYDLNEKKILLSNIKKLRTKYCIGCGKQSALPLPVCLHCGHSFLPDTKGKADLAIWAPDFTQKSLRMFFKKVCNRQVPKVPRNKGEFLIVNGISAREAELIVENARIDGITLDIRPIKVGLSKFRKSFLIAIGTLSLILWLVTPDATANLYSSLIGFFIVIQSGVDTDQGFLSVLGKHVLDLQAHGFFLLIAVAFVTAAVSTLIRLMFPEKSWISHESISPKNLGVHQMNWLTPYYQTIIMQTNPNTKTQLIRTIEQYIYITNHSIFESESIKGQLQQLVIVGLEILQWAAFRSSNVEAQERLNSCLSEVNLEFNLLIGRHLIAKDPLDALQLQEVTRRFRRSHEIESALKAVG